MTNLVLACPWCNSTRGNMPYEEWVASRGWILPWPKDLPLDVREMVAREFGQKPRGQFIQTGSTNSRIHLPGDDTGNVILEVRAGRDWEWHQFQLGRDGTRTTVYGAYEFIRRHLGAEKR